MTSHARSTDADQLTWLERVWIEVQNEINYESRHPQEDMSGPRQDWKRQCEQMADAWEE